MKQSVSDAVKSLINSSLREDDLEADESSGNDDDNDDYSDHFDDHDDMTSPPPSPPPTTPSKKPVILKKSSSRSFQLPSRPDGKLELIKHDSSETKFAGISAKAKAKQLARSQISNNELFDKLFETDPSSKKEAVTEENGKSEVTEEKVNAELNKSNNTVKDEKEVKSIETYDFECDTELFKPDENIKSPVKKSEIVKSPEAKEAPKAPEIAKSPSKSPVKVINNISPNKTEIKTVVTPAKKQEELISKVIIKSPESKELKTESSSIVTVSKPVIVSKQNIQNETKSIAKNIVVSSPKKIVLSPEKPKIISSNKKPIHEKRIITIEKPVTKAVVDTAKTVPIQNKPVEISPKKSEVVQKQVVVSLDTAKKPLIQKKPILVNTDKPVITGLGLSSKPVVGGVSKISKNIVLSKPVVSIQSSQRAIAPSPVKVGTKIVTIAPPQDSSIKPSSGSGTHITLANKKKEEKPLTVSLETRKTTIKPIVKTVEIPKRVTKILGASSASSAIVSSPSKPVVHLADKGIKSPSFEIKL